MNINSRYQVQKAAKKQNVQLKIKKNNAVQVAARNKLRKKQPVNVFGNVNENVNN